MFDMMAFLFDGIFCYELPTDIFTEQPWALMKKTIGMLATHFVL